jgi:hypothetical protein
LQNSFTSSGNGTQICLLGGIDTMDNGGYMERFKDKTCVLEVFRNNCGK